MAFAEYLEYVVDRLGDMFKNIFLSNLSIAFRYIGSFVVTIIIARTYSKESFGVYQLALSTLAIMENISFFSPQHLKLHLVKTPTDASYVYSAWVFQVVILFLANLMFVISGYLWGSQELHLYWIMMLILVFRTAFRYMDYVQIIADSRLRNDIVQKDQLVSISVFNLTRFVFSYFKWSILAVAAASITQGVASAIYQYSWKKRLQLSFNIDFNIRFFWGLVSAGGLLSLVTLMNILQSRFLSFLIVEKIGFSKFSDFQLTLKLVEPITALGTVAVVSNFTLLSNSFIHKKKEFKKRFLRTALVAIGISSLASLVLIIIPKNLIVVILGDGYRSMVDDLWVGCLVAISTVIFNVAALLNQIQKNYLQMLWKCLVIGLLYLLASQFLVMEIGSERLLWLLVIVPMLSIVVIDIPGYLLNKRK